MPGLKICIFRPDFSPELLIASIRSGISFSFGSWATAAASLASISSFSLMYFGMSAAICLFSLSFTVSS